MEGMRQPPSGARRRWRLVGALLALASIAVIAVVPQAPAHVTRDVPHMIEHLLEAVAGVQETADAIEEKTAGMPVVVTDTFHEAASAGGDGFVAQHVEGLDGKEFLANITVHCTFGTRDDNTDENTAFVNVRMKTPTGSGPFFTTFSEESTDRIVTLVTGPFAGFDGGEATYFAGCSPGGDNSFSQAMGQAWFEVVP
jgi:hypothetical protein